MCDWANESMEIVVTAVGPDNVGLADPIIHEITGQGANIAEIQMYDHDEAAVFAMMCRLQIDAGHWDSIRAAMAEIGRHKKLSVRVWTPEPQGRKPRLAICTTFQEATPRAVLEGVKSGLIDAEATVMIGNRGRCQSLAQQYDVPWHNIGRDDGTADEEAMVRLLDEYEVDYVVLARYMRVLPPDTCWKFAGGRIINLHHGLLPSFPDCDHIMMPMRFACSHSALHATSLCRNWMRAIRSFTNQPLRCPPVRNWKPLWPEARPKMNRDVWSKACGASWLAK